MTKWCSEINFSGNFGSNTFRKTWGYQQRIRNNASIALLMNALGHSSEAQTIRYIGLLQNEVAELYLHKIQADKQPFVASLIHYSHIKLS